MSTSIDQQVIQMKFDNDEFERRTSKTLSTLDALKSKLNFSGAEKGLTDLNKAAKSFTLQSIGQGIDELKDKFTALNVVGVTALVNIANRAINAGAEVIKSLTIGPISQGLADYNTKLTSVQTIMNATGANINTVNGFFKQLDTYSDKTIYNLTDMTSAFAKFTNAGVDMDKSVPAIKGIANMVAVAGQGADAAQIAMYNLSQSIAGGFLTTTDYKSLNLANVATKEWKNNIIQAAVAAGKLKKGTDGLYHIPGSKKAYTDATLFTDGLSEQWATTNILLKVLGDYGDTTTAIGKKAQAAAQNVKSLPMMMDTLKASVGTGWTDSFEFIFGNVEESTKLFTGMTNAIQSVLDKSAFARNHMLHQWKDLGGRTAIIDAISNAWKALGAVLKPIGDAWKEVFPPGAGKALADISFKIREFTKHLMISGDTAQRIKSTFEGVFSIFKIGIMIIKGLGKALFGVLGVVGSASGGVLSITAIVGEFIRKIYDLLNTTNAIEKFFTALVSPLALIRPVISLVSRLAGALGSLFMGDVGGFTARVNAAFSVFGKDFGVIGDKINAFINTIGNAFSNLAAFFANLSLSAQRSGNSFVAAWASRFAGLAGVISGFAETVRQFISHLISSFGEGTKDGKNFLSGFGSGTIDGVVTIISALVDKFHELKDAMNIGGAFSQMAAGAGEAKKSLSQLSAVGDGVQTATSGIGKALMGIAHFFEPVINGLRDFFTTVVTKITSWIKEMNFQDALAVVNTGIFMAMYLTITRISHAISQTFNQLTSTLKSMQNNVKSNIIMKIAISVGILVAALVELSRIDAKSLSSALGALTAVFVELGLALKYMNFDQKGLIRSGTGLILLATAIRILVGAVEVLGKLKLATLAQGIGALTILLGMLLASVTAMDAALPGARALVIISTALGILMPVLIALGLIPFRVLAQGLTVVGAALLILGAAANMMDAALPGARAILIIAGALAILTPVLIAFGLMPWKNILKSMVVLAATLAMLVVAANAMDTALPGAAAILIMAAALAVLAPTLIAFGMMKWSHIAKGLVTLAAVFAIFVAAMYALTPVIAILSIFAGSIVLLGAGLLLAGAGMALFAGALAALAVSGAAGFLVLIAGINGFLQMLPLIAQQFGLALVAFAVVLGQAAPKLIDVFTKITLEILKSLQRIIPEFVKTVGVLIVSLVEEVAKRAPELYDAGLRMFRGFLKAVGDHVVEITKLGIDLVVKFMNAISDGLPRLVDAGVNMIISFINSLSDAIDEHSTELGEAGGRLAIAMVTGMGKGLLGMTDYIVDQVKKLADKLPFWVKKVLRIESPSKVFADIGKYSVLGLAQGLNDNARVVESSANSIGEGAINAMKDSLSGLGNDITGPLDIRPTITPVLDLTGVSKDAKGMGSMFGVQPIALGATYDKATAASTGYKQNQSAVAIDAAQLKASIQAISESTTKVADVQTPRPVTFNIDTVEDGDSLLRRARATNKMLTLAEGGDSTQVERIL